MSTESTTEVTTPAPSSTTTPGTLVGAEAKPAEGEVKPVEGEAKPGEPAKPAAEPEFKALAAADIKLPEGTSVDEPAMTKFLEIANELKMPAEKAQALVSLQADLLKQASEAGSKLWEETQTKWQDEVRADPEIGGQKLDENLSHVAKLITRFGGDQAPAINEAFAITGAGNHPAIVRLLVKVSKELSESGPLSGGPGNTPQDAASLLYPNQGKA